MVSHAPRVRSHDCPIAEAEFHQLIEDIWKDDRDFWWHELMKEADDKCKNIGGQWRTQKFLEGVLDTKDRVLIIYFTNKYDNCSVFITMLS